MKKIMHVIVSFISFIICTLDVFANSINKIDMDVYINSNGDASIKEVWDATLYEGTEGYRPYTDMGTSIISDFSVTDDTGKIYEFLDSWNTRASFDGKAYKNGFNNISNGVELCFGISKYGNRKYYLKYNISNFVTLYSDNIEGIYFKFINLDQDVLSAKITIHSDVPFSLDNSKIWAFGYDGEITFKDGSIVLETSSRLSKYDYMTGLIRFEEKIFNTNNKSNYSFDDEYDSAFNDVNDEEREKAKDEDALIGIISLIIGIIVSVVYVIIICFGISFFFPGKNKGINYSNNYITGIKNTLPKGNKVNYYREIPCDKDLGRAYFVLKLYEIDNIDTLKKGLIGAILLKWIKEKYITVTKTKGGLFSIKDNNYAIDLSNSKGLEKVDSEIEKSLYKIIIEAAGNNKILEAKEFSNWSRNNCYKLSSWYYFVYDYEFKKLEKEKLIVDEISITKGIFGINKKSAHKAPSPELKEDAINLLGLKRYLLDFSLMPKREAREVIIWEEYLMFAELLGIANKVREQFSKLYPELMKEYSNFNVASTAVRSMAGLCYSSMKAGQSASSGSYGSTSSSHNYSGTTRRSGSGGHSYHSGGSSSHGSHGGGFR